MEMKIYIDFIDPFLASTNQSDVIIRYWSSETSTNQSDVIIRYWSSETSTDVIIRYWSSETSTNQSWRHHTIRWSILKPCDRFWFLVLKKYICLTLFFVFFYPHTDKHLAVLSQRTSKTVNTHILTLCWMMWGIIRYLFWFGWCSGPRGNFWKSFWQTPRDCKSSHGSFLFRWAKNS